MASVFSVAFCVSAEAAQADTVSVSRLVIVPETDPDDSALRIAKVLQKRILKRSRVSLAIAKEPDGRTLDQADCVIYLVRGKADPSLAKICQASGTKLPEEAKKVVDKRRP